MSPFYVTPVTISSAGPTYLAKAFRHAGYTPPTNSITGFRGTLSTCDKFLACIAESRVDSKINPLRPPDDLGLRFMMGTFVVEADDELLARVPRCLDMEQLAPRLAIVGGTLRDWKTAAGSMQRTCPGLLEQVLYWFKAAGIKLPGIK